MYCTYSKTYELCNEYFKTRHLTKTFFVVFYSIPSISFLENDNISSYFKFTNNIYITLNNELMCQLIHPVFWSNVFLPHCAVSNI